MLDARTKAWGDDLVVQGIDEGQAPGIERGHADERVLLCGLAAVWRGNGTKTLGLVATSSRIVRPSN